MNSVNIVAKISPPIITIASGRWLSDPMPWLKAAGSNPRIAIMAVISTERVRDCIPKSTDSASGCPMRMKFLTGILIRFLFGANGGLQNILTVTKKARSGALPLWL